MKRVLVLFALIAAVSLVVQKVCATNYRTAVVLAYSPANNVYEDENIRLEIYKESLWANNKTNKTIFIDLSQCFVVHNGATYPMYDNHRNENDASKGGLSTSIGQFISIAPSMGRKQNDTFICKLAGGIYGKYTTAESPSGDFSEYEERLLSLLNEAINESLCADPEGKQYLGSVHYHLTEDESVNNIGAHIAYAFNKRAEEWNPVVISSWVSDFYFTPYYVEMPFEADKKQQRGFGVKKTEAAIIHVKAETPFEFDSDKSPIIVADWTGNFKKGEFELNPTWVSKKKGMSFGEILVGSLATIATGGLTVGLLINDEEIYYKGKVLFTGADVTWPDMKYMKSTDLTKFNNDR